jgi:hypothetical protein
MFEGWMWDDVRTILTNSSKQAYLKNLTKLHLWIINISAFGHNNGRREGTNMVPTIILQTAEVIHNALRNWFVEARTRASEASNKLEKLPLEPNG